MAVLAQCALGDNVGENMKFYFQLNFAYNFVQIQKYTEENMAGNFRVPNVLAL